MPSRHVLVAGNGMVGQRFVDRLAAAGDDVRVTVVGEERRPAYDRVALSSWFDGRSATALQLVSDFVAVGDRVVVASPLHEQRFDLRTGE